MTSISNKRTREQSPTPTKRFKKTPKRVCEDTDDVLQEAIHQLRALSSSQDMCDANSDFGNVVANDMRQMSNENKIYAQKIITEILFWGKLGKLSSSTMIVE